MNFFNRSKTRSPVESVRVLRDYLPRLDTGSGESKKKVSAGEREGGRAGCDVLAGRSLGGERCVMRWSGAV